MSLKPQAIPDIPKMTVKVAKTAFRKGNIYMQMRDVLDTFFTNDQFTDLYPADGQPATLHRSVRGECRHDDMPARFKGMANLFDVALAEHEIGQEMKNGAIMS